MNRLGHKLAGIIIGLGIFLGSATQAHAQLVVQQPVQGGFGLRTTVSVPDRGSISLGGVNRGATGYRRSGPFRSGTNSGREFSGSSSSARVTIIDHHELDAAVLAQARAQQAARASSAPARISSRAEAAWSHLQASSQQR